MCEERHRQISRCIFVNVLIPSLQCVVDDNGEPTDELSPEAVEFCQRHSVKATKVSEIIANKEPAIYQAIQEGVERVNARANSNAQKVQKWVLLDKDFSISGGELGMFVFVLFIFLQYESVVDSYTSLNLFD